MTQQQEHKLGMNRSCVAPGTGKWCILSLPSDVYADLQKQHHAAS